MDTPTVQGGVNVPVQPKPALNANFSTPTIDTTTKAPPAVMTSDKAVTNNQKIGSAITQANTDLANHTASVNSQTPVDTTKNPGTDTTKTAETPTVDDQINELMKNLGYDLSQTADMTPEQKQTILEDKDAMRLDTTQLDTNNPDSVASKVQAMLNGSYPLSVTEQASVNNIKAQFAGAMQQAQQIAKNLIGGATVSAAKYGLQMYSPAEAMSNIQKAVDEGNTKIADINTRILDTQGKLTQSFQDNDYKQATALYDKIGNDLKLRTDEINNINKSVQDMTKQMHDDAETFYKDHVQAVMDDHTISYQDKAQTISQANLDEKTRHDMATELLQKQTAGDGTNLAVPPVNMTADGTPSPQDQTTFLASLPGGANGTLATMVKGLTSYQTNPAGFSTSAKQSQGNLTHAQIVALAQQYDPTYNEAQYATRQAYLKSLTSGPIYQGMISGNKAINHLIAFTDTISKLHNGIFSTLNAVTNATSLSQTQKQNLATAKTEASGLKDELAKFFKGTGATDTKSIEDWSQNLDVNASPATQKGLIQGALNLLAGQLDTVEQSYKSTMGKAPTGQIIQPQTLQKLSELKNQGYTVDIPGVNYTNKDAYFKYGGGTPEKLIQAHDTLIKANDPSNPPTPENALELAQIQ